MRIKYFGGNKENITGRLAVIRFTDNEWDLYDFIANYENTHGDKTRKFNGRVFVDERDENGVTINEAFIDVDGFDDFINFKANFEEAKKEFKSLKKQVTETEPETATETEPGFERETAKITKPLEIIFDDENSKHKIRTKFYLLETFNRLNINHYYVEIMTDKRVGAFYLYLKFDENGNEEKAMCRFFNIIPEFRNNAFETLFLYALAEKYNGVYCTPDFDDFAYYKKISNECKMPETFEPFISSGVKCFFISPDKNSKKSAINSLYGIASNTSSKTSTEYDETKELLAEEQFERLTRTLYKSLFKAIGLKETRKIPFIISNNMVFFNYNGTQYKYYPSQCKIFKKCGRKYQRINWKDFAEENNPDGQKQKRGRSPPLLLI